jgi:hypothetical protein
MRILTKQAYAALKFRNYSTVRDWIKSGLISPEALVVVPYGRSQVGIWVERADADLAERLNPARQKGQGFPIATKARSP